jgi:hypothetical protein
MRHHSGHSTLPPADCSHPADEFIRMASYLNPHSTCPIDIGETAEAYVMKRLSTADALRFAIHCLTCRHCAAATEEAENFVRAMKVAAQQFKVERPRLSSQATVTKVTTVRPGVVRTKMRFEVTAEW